MAGSLLVLFVGLFLLNGLMYLQQPAMTFFPERTLVATPANWGFEYEDVALDTEDGVRLHGWYIPRPGARRVLLFFHGNAGNISHRGDSIAIFNRLGLNVLIFDYRGYGLSQGKPDEQGLYRDAVAAWRYLTDTRGFTGSDIVIFGRSLGGAVGARLASNVEPDGLILESVFSSAADISRALLPVLSRLVVLRYRFDAVDALKGVHCPVLVLHSPDDEIIPFRLGQKLYRAANEPRTFVELQGDHNGGFLQSQPHYEQALGEFLTQLR